MGTESRQFRVRSLMSAQILSNARSGIYKALSSTGEMRNVQCLSAISLRRQEWNAADL